METFLRLGIKFGDILVLRIGIFSYEYSKRDQDNCLKDYDLNFVFHAPYLEAETCIQIIEKLTSIIYVSAHGEELYIDSGSELTNKDIIVKCLSIIMSYYTIPIICDVYYNTIMQISINTNRPVNIMKEQIMHYKKNSSCHII